MLTAKNDAEDRSARAASGRTLTCPSPPPRSGAAGHDPRVPREAWTRATNLIAAQAKSLEIISAGLAHEIHNPLSYVRNAQFVIAQSAEHVVRVASALPPGTLDEEAQARLTKAVGKIESMTSVAGGGSSASSRSSISSGAMRARATDAPGLSCSTGSCVR